MSVRRNEVGINSSKATGFSSLSGRVLVQADIRRISVTVTSFNSLVHRSSCCKVNLHTINFMPP